MSTQIPKSKPEKAVAEPRLRHGRRRERKRGAAELGPGQRGADAAPAAEADPARGFFEGEPSEGSAGANEDVQR